MLSILTRNKSTGEEHNNRSRSYTNSSNLFISWSQPVKIGMKTSHADTLCISNEDNRERESQKGREPLAEQADHTQHLSHSLTRSASTLLCPEEVKAKLLKQWAMLTHQGRSPFSVPGWRLWLLETPRVGAWQIPKTVTVTCASSFSHPASALSTSIARGI